MAPPNYYLDQRPKHLIAQVGEQGRPAGRLVDPLEEEMPQPQLGARG